MPSVGNIEGWSIPQYTWTDGIALESCYADLRGCCLRPCLSGGRFFIKPDHCSKPRAHRMTTRYRRGRSTARNGRLRLISQNRSVNLPRNGNSRDPHHFCYRGNRRSAAAKTRCLSAPQPSLRPVGACDLAWDSSASPGGTTLSLANSNLARNS
jgi:hypothetical protein